VLSSVLVIDGATSRTIADANQLVAVLTDGSKSFATFLTEAQEQLEEPNAATVAREITVIGDAAIEQWMPTGSQ